MHRLEQLYTAKIVTQQHIKEAVCRAMGEASLDFCVYAIDPELPDRWCLYLPNHPINGENDLIIKGNSHLIEKGFRVLDLTGFQIFNNQNNAKLAYKCFPDIKSPCDNDVFDMIIKVAFVQFCYNLMYFVRSQIIGQSYRSRDLDTFWYRTIKDVILPVIACEGASAFVRHRSHLLKLRGTSELEILTRNNPKKVFKRDIFYLPEDDSLVGKSVRDRREIYEFDDFNPLPKDRYVERVSGDIWSRAYIPMLIRAQQATATSEANGKPPADRPAGLLRLVNPKLTMGNYSKRHFCWVDKFFVNFIVDVTTVLTWRYLEVSKAHDDVEQVFHALGSEIATIARNSEYIRDKLFGSEEFNKPLLKPSLDDSEEYKKISIALNDIKIYVEDIHFQFEKVKKSNLSDNVKEKSTDRFFSDVLMKLVNSAETMARIHGRKRVVVNDLKEAKLDQLPEVKGAAVAWLSVFRNLLENSVKYTHDEVTPEITITWHLDSADIVVVNFQDNGPGIPDEEREWIFRDGFRGRLALESGQKGSGTGLDYCVEVARRCGGKVELGHSKSGALFHVRMMRRRN